MLFFIVCSGTCVIYGNERDEGQWKWNETMRRWGVRQCRSALGIIWGKCNWICARGSGNCVEGHRGGSGGVASAVRRAPFSTTLTAAARVPSRAARLAGPATLNRMPPLEIFCPNWSVPSLTLRKNNFLRVIWFLSVTIASTSHSITNYRSFASA